MSSKKKIVITEFMDEAAVDSLKKDFDVVYDKNLVDDPGRLKTELENAHGLIVRNRTQVHAALLAQGPHVIVVGRLGVGLDNIALDDCKDRHVKVLPATGCNNRSVAEYVIGCSMILIRSAYISSSRTAAGEWPRPEMIGKELSGKVFGFVGFGGVARETARLAKSFDCPCVAYDPYVEDAIFTEMNCAKIALDELFSSVDIVSVHVPLTDSTRNLIGSNTLKKMKNSSIVVNTARGGVVSEPDVIQGLKNGDIAGAAIDVFSEEPIVGDKAKPFSGVPNLLVTPHIAGVTKESNVRVSAYIAREVGNVVSAS